MSNSVLLLTMMIAAMAVLSAAALISYNVMQQASAVSTDSWCYKSSRTGLTCFAELSKCESERVLDKTSFSDRCFRQR